MTFEEWLIDNDYNENGHYPDQYYYSGPEWDKLYELYREECN